MDVIKRCCYRNCNKVVDDKTNKKYCSDSHRKMESVYVLREKKSILKEKNRIKEILLTFKNGYDEQTFELYKKIFNK
jgi:hypothetical protein